MSLTNLNLLLNFNTMKSEEKYFLFQRLKEEFQSLTDFENYSYFDCEFEIDESASTDEEIIVDLKMSNKNRDREKFFRVNFRVSREGEKDPKFEVMIGEEYEEWNCYGYEARELWRTLVFEAFDAYEKEI